MNEIESKGTCGTSCGCGSEVQGYWQDVENKVLDPKTLKQEFVDGEFDSFSISKNRRSFLKIMGFSVSALPLTGCIKIPVRKALPYLQKNDTVIPGVANWYASAWDGKPVLVKTREGRPIKIEGNPLSTVTQGGADAQTQASVLSLYDSYRYQAPRVGGTQVEWAEFDSSLMKELKSAKTNGKKIYVVTPSVKSPSELAAIKEFTNTYNAVHLPYDAVSYHAWTEANKITHGQKTFSEYDFEKAEVVVSIGADFLGTWGNTVANAKGFSKRRDPKAANGMNKHFQIEGKMSLTGSNADVRYSRNREEQRQILLGVLARLTSASLSGLNLSADDKAVVTELADALNANPGAGILLYGENCVHAQVVVNKINSHLGNLGSTVKVPQEKFVAFADDNAFETFVMEATTGVVGAVLYVGVNPAYTYPQSEKFKAANARIKTSVSFALSEDETAKLCTHVAPANHTYESWSDSYVGANEVAVTQPVIQPLFGTRMASETLLSLAGNTTNFHDYMQSVWKKEIHSSGDFTHFWNRTVHDGVVVVKGLVGQTDASVGDVSKYAKMLLTEKASGGLELELYTKVSMKDGSLAGNPWLQEMPDPVTKATWDNYLMVSPSYAKDNGLTTGSVVKVSNKQTTVSVPVMVQPGMGKNTVALAVGYGRESVGKAGRGVGVNAYPFAYHKDGATHYSGATVTVTKTGEQRLISQTQTHHSMEGRDIVRETTYDKYKVNPKAGNERKAKLVHIYPEHDKTGHQWAMAIDLNKCTGCSACIVSCNAENNIPVVGKVEVGRRREMHWLRLDRYYAGNENQPEVVHMPMLCQHCDNAPCENVCPVLATVQSSDGLNQQVYNRCVGTRYCANNCPYKVRRFNWFTYEHEDKVENMVLNPDVTVRTRGVMEKCSMCVQRIQEGKLEAKKRRAPLEDGAIKTACQQSCPSDAIVFGDKNDKNSKIAQFLGDERNYVVLGELNVQPRVSYMTKVRNK